MSFWESPALVTALVVACLLGAAEVLRGVPAVRKTAIPACILAGLLGMALGPDVADLLPVDRSVLETVVYHGLAIVFIAVALQSPPRSDAGLGASVKAFTFAIPVMLTLQTLVGLACVVALGVVSGTIHPGFGLMLPLGFEQGPGQALSLGAAWEKGGMTSGAQIGLIVATIGFGWSILMGLPLVLWGRRRGLLSSLTVHAGGEAEAVAAPSSAGGLDVLTRQVAVIGACYALTWGACFGLSSALSSAPDIAETIWGFHFILGAGVAMGVRAALVRLGDANPLHDGSLSRVAGVCVDWMTCSALLAVQLAVLGAHWLPIVLVTTVGGAVTLIAALWLCSRAFRDAPFEHAVVWFGMSTGTLPMGLALLRVVDPGLRSPAALSAVLGSAGAIAGAVPVLLFLIPGTVAAFASGSANAALVALGAAAGYLVLLLGLWWKLGGLRITRPATLWLEEARTKPPAT